MRENAEERKNKMFDNKILKNKIMILSLLVGAVYFFLKYILPLIGPLFLAMLFVTIFGPLLKQVQRIFKINRQISAAVLLIFATFSVLLLGWIVGIWFTSGIPRWQTEGKAMLGELTGYLPSFLNDTLGKWETDFLQGVMNQSVRCVKMVSQSGIFLIAFLIGSVLLAKDYDDMMNWLLEREECYPLLEVLCSVIRYVASFLRAQGIIMMVISFVSGLGLKLSGVANGLLWGVLAGALDALPFVGTGVILIPMALVYLVRGRVAVFVAALVLYGICILLRQILEPKLIGSRMGIPPIAVLFSIYAGVALFGVGGIVKGPLGYVLVAQTYRSICKRL